MIRENFLLATRNLTHRRLRSLLTIVGIFIGIAAVVALISIGDGLQAYVAGEFEKLGADKVTVMATAGGFISSPMASASSTKPLTIDEAEVVKKTPGVILSSAFLMKSVPVTFRGKNKAAFLYGLPLDESRRMLENSYEIEQGRKLKESDTHAVVLGSYVAKEMFERDIAAGDSIEVGGRKFTVVGVLKTVGNQFDDSTVMMPIDVARDITGDKKLVSMIIAQVSAGSDMKAVRDRVAKRLRDFRHEEEGEELFSVQTSEQLASTFAQVFAVIQAVIVGIAAISLLVGGIGIMNTMYTAVVERTNEIGIMKAVGAKNSDVLSVFLFEAGLLGLAGGAVGIGVGLGMAKIAEIGATQALGSELLKVNVSFELIVGALLFSFLVGAISGVLPARQASRLKPVDALRYE